MTAWSAEGQTGSHTQAAPCSSYNYNHATPTRDTFCKLQRPWNQYAFISGKAPWTGGDRNYFFLWFIVDKSLADSPQEDNNLCVFVDRRTSRWCDGPLEKLMSFCNYYRRSAQEKLEISVTAQTAVGNLKIRTGPGIPNSRQNRYKNAWMFG